MRNVREGSYVESLATATQLREDRRRYIADLIVAVLGLALFVGTSYGLALAHIKGLW